MSFEEIEAEVERLRKKTVLMRAALDRIITTLFEAEREVGAAEARLEILRPHATDDPSQTIQ